MRGGIVLLIKSIIASLTFLAFASITFGKLISLIKENITQRDNKNTGFYIVALLNSLLILVIYPYVNLKMFSGFLNSLFGIIFLLILNLAIGYRFTGLLFKFIIPTLKESDIIKIYLKNFTKKAITKAGVDKTGVGNSSNSILKIKEFLIKLGYSNVTCYHVRSDEGYACTYIDPKAINHEMWIYDPCMRMSWEKLSSVIGHEVVHIIRKNNTDMDRTRRVFGGIIIFLIPIVSMFMVYTLELYLNNTFGTLLILAFGLVSIISFLYMMIYFSFDSRRFWLQIDEIYCDRKACEFPGVEAKYMAGALKDILFDIEKYPRTKWFDKFYINYYMILEHPCLKYRIKLMEKYRKWNMFEYIRHLNVMFFWLITGRGWTGE